jgi:hypothetical protein
MRNKILVFFIIVSGMVSADTGSYVGYWSVKCGGFGGYINVSQSSTVTININDNNLLVDARLVESRGGYAELFFVDVLESRNEIINWDSISRSKPIAKLNFNSNSNSNSFAVDWFGFFDEKDQKYVWDTQPDFVVAEKKKDGMTLHKCVFD